MKHRFYFSAKHAANSAPHRCFVTIDGVEREYTEWVETAPEPATKHLGDLVLVAETNDKPKIRIENAPIRGIGFSRLEFNP